MLGIVWPFRYALVSFNVSSFQIFVGCRLCGERGFKMTIFFLFLMSICIDLIKSLYIQEIMILPIGASRFEEALQMGSETYHHLKVYLFV